MIDSTLFVGVGSPHGDDQVGWLVARALADMSPKNCEVRWVRSPNELLEPLTDRARLIVCDACRGTATVGTIHRWLWPTNELQQMRWSGTHDVTLPGALALAAQLNWLPPQVIIWAIDVGQTTPATTITPSLNESIHKVVARIAAELACDDHGQAISPPRSSAHA